MVYIINDWVDRKSDALNKNKKNRPFANKDLNFKDAALGTFFLLTIFLILFSQTYQISPGVCLLVVIYLIQGFLYSFYLKNISLIEMLLVSTGYSYRAFAGGLGIYLLPSSWMLITIFLASIFMVALKRLADKQSVLDQNTLRLSTKSYSEKFLYIVASISAGSAIISYILFTLSDYAQLKFENPYLPLSSIFIIYSTFRYLQVAIDSKEAHDPINLIIKDNHMKICILLFFIFIVVSNAI